MQFLDQDGIPVNLDARTLDLVQEQILLKYRCGVLFAAIAPDLETLAWHLLRRCIVVFISLDVDVERLSEEVEQRYPNLRALPGKGDVGGIPIATWSTS